MGNYVTFAEVQAEGLPAGKTPAFVERRIVKWEAIVERLTRNVFRELDPGELTFDGNNSAILWFNIPLIEVSSVKINDEDIALDTSDYRAFIGRQKPQDDRGNPKIKLTPVRASVFRNTPSMFVKGLDQKITAKWGYLEPDDSTPRPIKDAIIQLVLLDIDDYFAAVGTTAVPTTSIKRERTDGHEIEYMEPGQIASVWTMLPNDLMEILALYRAPFKVDAPEPLRFVSDPGIDVICV